MHALPCGGEAHIVPICIIQRSWISGTTLNLKGLMAGRHALSIESICIIQRPWISGTTLNLKGLMVGRCTLSIKPICIIQRSWISGTYYIELTLNLDGQEARIAPVCIILRSTLKLKRPWQWPTMANLLAKNFQLVTGWILTGRCQNFVHLVTGHTLGQTERNSTVYPDGKVRHRILCHPTIKVYSAWSVQSRGWFFKQISTYNQGP
jgi:hypothetical protein